MTTFEQLKKRTLELFQERPDPTDWADNLLEGSKGLQECDYGQYVQFLADPHTSYKPKPAQNKITVDTEEPNLTTDKRYCVESYENGTEVTLHYRRVSDDDEKESKIQSD